MQNGGWKNVFLRLTVMGMILLKVIFQRQGFHISVLTQMRSGYIDAEREAL